MTTPKVAVVIPCYRVAPAVAAVLEKVGREVFRIYCVDDACPDASGAFIETNCRDTRVRVIRHQHNQGVGGATITGFRAALADGAEIIVKIDGDGQMDPALIPRFLHSILEGRADYCKGNRFFTVESVQSMPLSRLVGNAVLSFISKLSSGYWNLFDPTNGFVAIHARVLALLPLEKIDRRYFFESDMCFRLNTIGAVVEDVPMSARYADEHSDLRIGRILVPFLWNHSRNFGKRVVYNHFLRNFSVASVELVIGALCMSFGVPFGALRWWQSIRSGVPVTAGTVMVAALPVILGCQLLLSFLSYDIRNVPQVPLHKRL
jgi:dolichol-phosphate mannosyltransferase